MTMAPTASLEKVFGSEAIRQLFPVLQQTAHGHPLVYLDNAATTQKPLVVIDAINDYYREKNANVHRAAHFLSARATHAYEDARGAVRAYLNARHSEEIIWTRGATEAINLVAQSWGRSYLREGDEILLSMMEHHANIVPWQLLARETGAVIKVIGLTPEGDLDLESFRSQLSKKTKLVSVAHISNAIGTVNPVKTIVCESKSIGATILIDGSQAIAHQTVDVQAMGCDFYVFSGHKAFGPTGIGALYGRKELLDSMPPWQAGGEMIQHVSFEETTFNQLPFKFEAGTPHIAGAIGLASALSFISQYDLSALAEHEQALRKKTESGLMDISGIRLIGQARHKASVVSFVSEKIHNQDLGLMLDQQGVAVRVGHHCAMPLMESYGLNGTVRASMTLYNSVNDVDAFLTAVESLHKGELFAVPEIAEANHEVPDLFAQMPFGQTINQQAINKRLLTHSNWQERYRQIMLLGKELPALPDSKKTNDALLHGCESRVWLHHYYDEETQKLYFLADSDARVIRGLIALVLVAFNGKTVASIKEVDLDEWFFELELMNHLSPSRSSGLNAFIKELSSIARRYF